MPKGAYDHKGRGPYNRSNRYRVEYTDPETGETKSEEFTEKHKAVKFHVDRLREGYTTSMFGLLKTIWRKIF